MWGDIGEISLELAGEIVRHQLLLGGRARRHISPYLAHISPISPLDLTSSSWAAACAASAGGGSFSPSAAAAAAAASAPLTWRGLGSGFGFGSGWGWVRSLGGTHPGGIGLGGIVAVEHGEGACGHLVRFRVRASVRVRVRVRG